MILVSKSIKVYSAYRVYLHKPDATEGRRMTVRLTETTIVRRSVGFLLWNFRHQGPHYYKDT